MWFLTPKTVLHRYKTLIKGFIRLDPNLRTYVIDKTKVRICYPDDYKNSYVDYVFEITRDWDSPLKQYVEVTCVEIINDNIISVRKTYPEKTNQYIIFNTFCYELAKETSKVLHEGNLEEDILKLHLFMNRK